MKRKRKTRSVDLNRVTPTRNVPPMPVQTRLATGGSYRRRACRRARRRRARRGRGGVGGGRRVGT